MKRNGIDRIYLKLKTTFGNTDYVSVDVYLFQHLVTDCKPCDYLVSHLFYATRCILDAVGLEGILFLLYVRTWIQVFYSNSALDTAQHKALLVREARQASIKKKEWMEYMFVP